MQFLMMMSVMFLSSPHPVSQITLMIMSCLMISMTMTTQIKNSWFSMVFILMILGSLLILFIYMASIMANEPIKFSKSILLTAIMTWPMMKLTQQPSMTDNKMNMIFSSSYNYLNIICMIYLLISLLVIIENIISIKSPLRSNI